MYRLIVNRSRHRRLYHLGVFALAVLLLVQSVVATLPNLGAGADPVANRVSTDNAAMPCEHGDCCDEDAPPSTPCDEMATCASSDCALRAIASLPTLALVTVPMQVSMGQLPADAPQWLLTRHDTPLLRPPISA